MYPTTRRQSKKSQQKDSTKEFRYVGNYMQTDIHR